ncbi:14233_t:CDS:1, partial [Racocetra persica]
MANIKIVKNTTDEILPNFVKQDEVKIKNFFYVRPELKEASEKLGLNVEFISEKNQYKVSPSKKIINEILKHF